MQITHPGRKPQGGVHAYIANRGRAWIESIHSLNGTALVRFNAGIGMRSRCEKVKLSDVDFTRE